MSGFKYKYLFGPNPGGQFLVYVKQLLVNGYVCVAAMQHLDKLKLWGKNIKCSPSKHTMVQLPKEGQPVSVSPQLTVFPGLVVLSC